MTAYRWVFYPASEGLVSLGLPPAVKGDLVAERVVKRLADQHYGTPKILTAVGAVYFDSKILPQVWKDEGSPLDLKELYLRFPSWTYLPMLPECERVLTECIRDGLRHQLWAVALGDAASATFRDLIESPDGLDRLQSPFDGSASLVKGALVGLIREQLGREPVKPAEQAPRPPLPPDPDPKPKPIIPPPPPRYARVVLKLADLPIGKTANLQPYLFKVIQEQDVGSKLNLTIHVTSGAGISQEVLEKRIREGLDQLGIAVEWEEG